MKKIIGILMLVSVMALVLAACGGSGGGSDTKAGEKLFNETIIDDQPGCVTCHSLTADTVIVGPSLAGIGTTAATRVAGVSAEEYIRNSITHPDDYVVEGFDPGIMVQVWEQKLTTEQIDSLVAFLISQK